MDLNEMNPVLLVATLTQQVVELEKKLEADGENAEIKAALSGFPASADVRSGQP